jgi:hypothetical protein
MENGCVIWNLEYKKALYRAESLETAARELGKYSLDILI